MIASASTARAEPVIGLFTDYGWDDPYVAQLKGVILTIDANARILDITHTVTPFNVTEGAYLPRPVRRGISRRDHLRCHCRSASRHRSRPRSAPDDLG